MGKLVSWFRNINFYYYQLFIYLGLVIFAPYIKIAGRDNFEITFIVTLLFIVFVPKTLKMIRDRQNGMLNIILAILFIILFFDCVSIVNYVFNYGFENIIANIIPNAKVFLYILLVIAFYNLEYNDGSHRLLLHRVIPCLAVLLSIIGIFQYFNILNINGWFTSLFITGEGGKALAEVLEEKQQFGRALGTLSNPNFFSLQLIILLIFIVSNILSVSKAIEKIVNTFIALLLFAAIVLTQSRTALVIIAGIFIYVMIVQIIRGKAKSIAKYVFISGVLLLLAYITAKAMNLYYLLDALNNGLNTHTLTMRVDRWRDALELFKLHPFVGIGPVIQTYFSAVDNEYIHILRNYGVIGLFAHISFYFYIFVATFKDMLSEDGNPTVMRYSFALNCAVLAVMIANITMATFYMWRNFVLLLILCCTWAVIRSKYKNSQGC